jgi:hypothetical protein
VSLAVCGTAFAQTPQPDPKDPLYQHTGEQSRSYLFPGTTEAIPYHLYVPAKWKPGMHLPLVVVTHGANQPSTAPFQRPMTNPTLAKAAEGRGYIVAAVTGYHANATGVGGWNVPYKMIQVPPQPGRGGAAAAWRRTARAADGRRLSARRSRRVERGRSGGARIRRRSQAHLPDGQLVGRQRRVDLRDEYPERWAAIAPSAAPLDDAAFPYEKLKTVPVLVIHGDMDTTMVFDASKTMVDHAQAKGVDATWLPWPAGCTPTRGRSRRSSRRSSTSSTRTRGSN